MTEYVAIGTEPFCIGTHTYRFLYADRGGYCIEVDSTLTIIVDNTGVRCSEADMQRVNAIPTDEIVAAAQRIDTEVSNTLSTMLA